jgi:hypothetical protein
MALWARLGVLARVCPLRCDRGPVWTYQTFCGVNRTNATGLRLLTLRHMVLLHDTLVFTPDIYKNRTIIYKNCP